MKKAKKFLKMKNNKIESVQFFFFIILTLDKCDANSFSYQLTIQCKPEHASGRNADEVYRFDCSSMNITWSIINDKIFERMYNSRQINLSKNRLESKIKNFTFSKFQELKFKLNLSSNEIEDVESNAFGYLNNDEFDFLMIHTLDLSHNKITTFPYSSLATLPNLINLYLSFNEIQQFDFDDQQALKRLKYLHLNGCKLKYLNYEFLSYIQKTSKLKYLNLNDNQFISFDQQQFISLPSPNSLFIELQSNPFNCSCELLWLKYFLLKQKNSTFSRDSEEDIEDFKFQISNTIDLYDRTTCHIDYNEYQTYINETDSNETTISSLNNNSEKMLKFFVTKLTQLEDRQFLCPIQIISTSSSIVKGQMRLECEFSSFPEAHVWWLFSEKTINSGYSGGHYKIDLNVKKNDSIFVKRSTLYVNDLTEDDNGSYKCCVSFNSAVFDTNINYKVTTSEAPRPFSSILLSNLVNQNNIFSQRLNRTIFQQVDIDFSGYVLPKGARIVASGPSTGVLITESALGLYLHTNKKVIYIVCAIAAFLVVVVIIILAVKLSLHRNKNTKTTDLEHRKVPIYSDDDYSKHYEEIQQLKLRQHDGFEYDDTKYNNIYKIYKSSIRENLYDNISRDDDAISSISSKSGGGLDGPGFYTKDDSIDIEENLNEYEDPSLVNLRKPNQITSVNV